MSMICCTHSPLYTASNLGIASIQQAQIFSGGENQEGSFDYIRNIVPVTAADGSIIYNVEVGRLPCISPRNSLPPSYTPYQYVNPYYFFLKKLKNLDLS